MHLVWESGYAVCLPHRWICPCTGAWAYLGEDQRAHARIETSPHSSRFKPAFGPSSGFAKSARRLARNVAELKTNPVCYHSSPGSITRSTTKRSVAGRIATAHETEATKVPVHAWMRSRWTISIEPCLGDLRSDKTKPSTESTEEE